MKRHLVFFGCAAVWALILGTVTADAQSTPPGAIARARVVVTTKQGEPIASSAAELIIKENGKVQRIVEFEGRDEPMSIGLLVDSSGSMTEFPPGARQVAVYQFLLGIHPQDEVFLVEMSDDPELRQAFTQDHVEVVRRVSTGQPLGQSALADAIRFSTDYMVANARNARRELILISDLEENASEMKRRLAQDLLPTGVGLHALFLPNPASSNSSGSYMEKLLHELGGVVIQWKPNRDQQSHGEWLARALQQSYVVGWTPTPGRVSGKQPKLSFSAARKGIEVHARELQER